MIRSSQQDDGFMGSATGASALCRLPVIIRAKTAAAIGKAFV